MSLVFFLGLLAMAAVARGDAAPCSGTVASAQHTLPIIDPTTIPKWMVKLPNPFHPSFIFTPDRTTHGADVDYYRIGMRQIVQQILPPGCPATPVWAYGNADEPMETSNSYHSPGHTIVAFKGRVTKVDWVHDQLPAQHLFKIDRTFHCGSAVNCTPDVRTVVHLHGGHVEPDSDGFPEAWVASDGVQHGLEYKANTYVYANDQEGATLWYHDHAQGITRLNVYAGLAGFYVLRGNREISLQSLNLLPRYPYDIPIVIQDRHFFPNGSLAYPDAPFTAPRITNTNFGTVFMVNGAVWPKMLVEHRRYRMRILNGCNSRFLSLAFVSSATSNPTVVPVTQVGVELGLLNSPVDLTNTRMVLAPAERIDIVVDFTNAKQGERFVLTNTAPTPYPYGAAVAASDPMAEVIQFRAKLALNVAIPSAQAPPASLRNNQISVPANFASMFTRKLVLFDVVDQQLVRLRRQLGTDAQGALSFCDTHGITEQPTVGVPEVWEIYNPTGETHPIHVHLVYFQIIDRHNIDYTNGRSLGTTSYPVLDSERGPKDTVRVDPNTVVRVIMTFDRPGLYVWHCHILEHEDYDMMRPVCVGGNCSTAWEVMADMPWKS